MAITKVSQYNSTPTTVADYQAQNAHLQAMINKANGSMSILNQTSTTSVPYIALGTYIMMGGTLYVVDTSNYTIQGSVVSGENYIYLTASGDTLTATWTQSLTGYEWNSIYNYYSDGTNILLPYIVDYDGTNYLIAQFDRNFNQQLRTTSDVTFNDVGAKKITCDSLFLDGPFCPSISVSQALPYGPNFILVQARGFYMVAPSPNFALSIDGGATYATNYFSNGACMIADGVKVIIKNELASVNTFNYIKF